MCEKHVRYGFYFKVRRGAVCRSRWTPNAKPRLTGGVCIIYRSRKEVLLMYLLMLFVLLILLRKRRTKLKIEIDL
jgi:hypothetical protein